MSALEEYKQFLQEKGVSLHRLGIQDVALDRVDALIAVDLLRKASVPILGGDVYFAQEIGIEPAYANWHSDREPGEHDDRFVDRSCLETENYIKNFTSPNKEALFMLVLGD